MDNMEKLWYNIWEDIVQALLAGLLLQWKWF